MAKEMNRRCTLEIINGGIIKRLILNPNMVSNHLKEEFELSYQKDVNLDKIWKKNISVAVLEKGLLNKDLN